MADDIFAKAFGEWMKHDLRNTFMNYSVQYQEELVERNYQIIQFHDAPSPKLQLLAVQQSPHAVEYIDNPCEEVKIYLGLIG